MPSLRVRFKSAPSVPLGADQDSNLSSDFGSNPESESLAHLGHGSNAPVAAKKSDPN